MQLEINEKQRELKSHGCFEFPVFISQEILSRYERGAFTWHWHPEIELTLIMEGNIRYQVNGQVYDLKPGEGLFCNANALHAGHMTDGKDCYYISTTFHPRIIYGFEGSILQTGYMNPILDNASFGSRAFHPDGDWQSRLLGALRKMYALFLESPPAFELLIQQQLSAVWLELYTHMASAVFGDAAGTGQEIERLRGILRFLQEHYAEKITLDDIADQSSICKSECCRFFKKHMGESLFDYLLYYRIEKSLPLLAGGRLSVTEAAEKSGFASPGYFSRVFRQQMNCSPSQYKERRLKTDGRKLSAQEAHMA